MIEKITDWWWAALNWCLCKLGVHVYSKNDDRRCHFCGKKDDSDPPFDGAM